MISLNKLKYWIIGILALCVIVFFIPNIIPHNSLHIAASRVERIEIRLGNTGKYFDVTEREAIEKICNNFSKCKSVREFHGIGMGYRFGIKFYDKKGNKIKDIIIKSETYFENEGISKFIFGYDITSGKINFELLNSFLNYD